MRNSKLEALLAEYDVALKTTPHLGYQGMHAISMLPKIKGFAEQVTCTADVAKINRWLGFVQAVLWLKCGRSIEELRDETRGIDDTWPTLT